MWSHFNSNKQQYRHKHIFHLLKWFRHVSPLPRWQHIVCGFYWVILILSWHLKLMVMCGWINNLCFIKLHFVDNLCLIRHRWYSDSTTYALLRISFLLKQLPAIKCSKFSITPKQLRCFHCHHYSHFTLYCTWRLPIYLPEKQIN